MPWHPMWPPENEDKLNFRVIPASQPSGDFHISVRLKEAK